LAGEYESTFKGRGMEFDEVREYQPGDEIRTIDWNVTARTGKPYVKRYVEERELTVLFLVDLSASGEFGSHKKTKNQVAAELCALLAFAAVKNNDKVGLTIFTDHIETFIPPQKGTRHVLRLIREVLSFEAKHANTNIAEALDYIGKITNKRSVIFLISDFQERGFEKSMRVMSKRHDLIAVSINDPRELEMPDVGFLEFEDAETGELITIDTTSLKIRNKYSKLGKKRLSNIKEICASMGVDQIEIQTDRNYIKDIMKFFLAREHKSQRR
jgi:uncharacterized protein (DUF58 family)